MMVATVIAAGRLTGEMVDAVAAALGTDAPAPWRWLDEGCAADITLAGHLTAEEARGQADKLSSDYRLDIIIQRREARVPGLMLADMDSTMITVECIDELAARAGLKDRVAAITERAMRGEVDFAEALAERVALLRGLPLAVIGDVLRDAVRATPGGATLIATLKAHGARAVLVSGGFTAFADPVGAALGFDRVVANRLGVDGAGRLAGAIDGPIVDAARKASVLAEERHAAGSVSVIAIGDGANDLPMLAAADLGVAYRAKPRVAAAADARIAHHGLDALLWAAGLPRAAWLIRPDPQFGPDASAANHETVGA